MSVNNDLDEIRKFIDLFNGKSLLIGYVTIFTNSIVNFFKKYPRHNFVIDIIDATYEEGQYEYISIVDNEIVLYTDYTTFTPYHIKYIYLLEDFEKKYPYITRYKNYMKKHYQNGEIFNNVYIFNKIHYVVAKPFLETILDLEQQNKNLQIEIDKIKYAPGGEGYITAKKNFKLRQSISLDSFN